MRGEGGRGEESEGGREHKRGGEGGGEERVSGRRKGEGEATFVFMMR